MYEPSPRLKRKQRRSQMLVLCAARHRPCPVLLRHDGDEVAPMRDNEVAVQAHAAKAA